MSDRIRNEVSISLTAFFPYYVYGSLKGQVTHANSPIWLKTEVQDFMPSFINSKYDIDPIKNKVAIALGMDNIFSIIYLWDLLVAIVTKVLIGFPWKVMLH